MTAQCVRRPAITLRVMLKNSGHAVSPNVLASWAKATAGFRLNRGRSWDPVGYDAGKKVKGIKRNALADTVGLVRRSLQASRTGTAPRNLSRRPAACSPSSNTSLQMAATAETNSPQNWPLNRLPWRSSSARIKRAGSSSSAGAGWPSAQPPPYGPLRSHRPRRRRLRQTRHDTRHAETPNRAKTKACNINF
jgi:hypothetical protein